MSFETFNERKRERLGESETFDKRARKWMNLKYLIRERERMNEFETFNERKRD